MIDSASTTATFSPDYFTARQRFRDAVHQLNWSLESHPVDARGPHDEELTIDVAVSVGADSSATMLVTSGVHGAEGTFGSAVQLAMLHEWRNADIPLRIVFVHAVNPFGFAHRRRFDEHNVDLNRNFLPDGEAFTGSPPMYAQLNAILNPRHPPRFDAFTLRSLAFIARYGRTALKQAIAGGQYDFPQGLFFGGHAPSQSHRILKANLARWLGESKSVMHLDYHTGLGEWGTYKLLLDEPISDELQVRLRTVFGPESLELMHQDGIAYESRGGFGMWCLGQNRHRDYVFLCPEFGTYDGITVLKGLRAENQSHHWCNPTDPARQQTKARLSELFVPADAGWRTKVLHDGQELIRRAASGEWIVKSG